MKKTIVLLLVINITTTAFSQNQTADSARIFKYKNMLGVDATGLLGTLWNNYSNAPVQTISYRRVFKKSALLFSVGGYLASSKENLHDSIFYQHSSKIQSLNFLMGMEWYKKISKKFILNYGIAATGGKYLYSLKYSYYDGSTFTLRQSITNNVGAMPFIGVLLNLTDRVAFATSTGFSINYSRTSTQYIYSYNYYVPNFTNYEKRITTQIIPPLRIDFRYSF
jgi:hypothetical protein